MGVEFVPSDPGPAPTLPATTPGPDTSEIFGAAFRQGNPIVSALSAARSTGLYEPQENYSAWGDIKDKPEYLEHANQFAGMRSPEEVQQLKDQIDQENHDKRILAASGAGGFLAATIAGTLDPTLLLPGRIAIGAARDGAGFLRGALEVGSAMAVQSSAQEMALQASQQTRTAGESILNVGSATVLGALLGSAAGFLTPVEHARLEDALDNQRAIMEEHANPTPPVSLKKTGETPRPEGTIQEFDVLQNDQRIAGLRVLPSKDGKDVFVKNITTGGPLEEATPEMLNTLGISTIRKVAREIQAEFPDAETISGLRTNPIRNDRRPVTAPLAAAAGPVAEGDHLGALRAAGTDQERFNAALQTLRDANPTKAELDQLGRDYALSVGKYKNKEEAYQDIQRAFVRGARFEAKIAPSAGFAGAAATDTRQARLVGAGGIEKLNMGPGQRVMNNPLQTARQTASDLIELPFDLQQNLPSVMRDERGEPLRGPDGKPLLRAGETTTLGGGPSVETAWRIQKQTAQMSIMRALDEGWKDLAMDKPSVAFNLMNTFGVPLKRGGYTAEEFGTMVSEAMAKGDTHAIPQVQAAAQKIRSLIEPWADRAEAAIGGFKKTEVFPNEGYFPHDWNRQYIRQNRDLFVNRLVGIFDADQRTNRDIQTRMQAFSDQLKAQEATIKRIMARKTRTEATDTELANAHVLATAARKKIEDELGKWQGTSTAEAKSALKARAKYEAERVAKAKAAGKEVPTDRLTSADDAVDQAVERILKSDQNLDVRELRDKAHETTDHILSSPDGRFYSADHAQYGIGPRPPIDALRGAEQHRLINISNAEAWDFLNHDPKMVLNKWLNTMIPDVLLAERFGDIGMQEQMRKILDEHSALSDAASSKAERVKLDKAKDSAINDIAAMRDIMRGVYRVPANETARTIGRVSAALRNMNVPMSMGMSAVSSFGDAAGVMMRYGMMSAFRDGFMPFVSSLMTDRKLARAELSEWRSAGIAIDTYLAARHHSIADVTDQYANGSTFERALQYGADKFQLLNMLGPWTDAIKSISSTVASVNLFKAAEAMEKGAATEKQLRALGAANINAGLAMRIAEQYRTHGTRVGGVLLPNLGQWTDKSAREAFNGAISREANIMVVTPGVGDIPLLMREPTVAVFTQFKSYTAAAHTRILLANLQRRDADALGGLVGALGLGMLSYKINSMTGGQPTSDNPGDWVKEGMSRANLLGWFEEDNAFAAKMTSGRLDAYRLTGSEHMLSKYAGRSVTDQLLGPTLGKLERLQQVTGAISRGDWKPSDSHALRQLVFMQNLVYFRQLFDQVDSGAHPPGH